MIPARQSRSGRRERSRLVRAVRSWRTGNLRTFREKVHYTMLPDAYVVKPTQGGRVAIIVSDRAPAEARLPTDPGSWMYRHVRPEFADRDDVVRIAAGWVAQLYGRGPNHEWVYGRIPRRILVEELVGGAILDDHEFFGELTSIPAGGNSPFDPESFDEEFGRRWTAPRSYR